MRVECDVVKSGVKTMTCSKGAKITTGAPQSWARNDLFDDVDSKTSSMLPESVVKPDHSVVRCENYTAHI